MIELFITYLVGALVGGTILVLWITRSIWPKHGVERSDRAAAVHRGRS